MEDAIRKSYGFLNDSKQHYIVTPNPEIVIHSIKNPIFRNVLNRSSISMPDGIGMVWASKILHRKTHIKERVSGVDFMCGFLEYLHKLHKIPLHVSPGKSYGPLRILFAGGSKNTARKTSEFFRKRFFSIKFYSIGNIHNKRSEFVIKHIIKPDIIFVAMGAPKQEMWIHKNLKKIPSVKLAMGVGGSFDFISGRIPRAPKQFQKAGIEWLWRFIMQPRRLKRILNAVVVFPIAVIRERLSD